MLQKSIWLPYVVLPCIIGLAVFGSCVTLARAFVRTKSESEVIRVTGSARKPIRSDFIVWHGRVSRRAPDVALAYRDVTSDIEKVKAYLLKKGVPAEEIIVSALETKTLYVQTKNNNGGDVPEGGADNAEAYHRIEGYELAGEIQVRSHNVDLVDQLSRQSSELISSGVALESRKPEYLYTKLSDLKVTMLAEAARDARARAEQIAISSGCRVGDVRFARMGIMQITPIYSTEVSGEGINDTSSLEKDITAIVSMGFSIR